MKVEKYIDTVSGKELKKEFHYFDSGQMEIYYKDGKLHREDLYIEKRGPL